jgi:hypothetical protein
LKAGLSLMRALNLERGAVAKMIHAARRDGEP